MAIKGASPARPSGCPLRDAGSVLRRTDAGRSEQGCENARLFGALARAGMVMVGEKTGGNR